MILKNLNDNQLKAAVHKDGPCLVIAGAGSGKTKVLTTRIANLIEEGISSSNILAITFTNKAAREMKERLFAVCGYNKSFVGTFHSFGVKILKENFDKVGLQKNFSIIDSDDVTSLIKKIMKDLCIDPKDISVNYVKSKISYIKNQMLTDVGIDRTFTNYIDLKVVEIYKRYVKILESNSAIDFDDLLKKPVELFLDYPEVLDMYSNQFPYILVDEYQDTNEVQYKLIKLISKKFKNIFVVGDVNQSIYSFRWSNYKNILNFEKDFEDVTVITLNQNYRSTTNILKAANDVISNNSETKEVDLFSDLGVGSLITYKSCENDRDENFFVASEIKKLLDMGYKKSDFACFYRTNAQSRSIEEAMIKASIPYKVVGSFLFYKRKEIKDLISYLKILQNSYDDISLERIINVPKRGIGASSINNLRDEAFKNSCSMFSAITDGKCKIFKDIIISIKEQMVDLNLTELIDLVLDKSGMLYELEAEKTLEADLRIENLMEFRSITENFQNETGNVSLDEFLDHISLVADLTEHKEDSDLVTLMTIHAAKGLEFRVVFVLGMEEEILPHKNSKNSKNDLEEERRLCYVAITRAREKLYLSNSKSRMLYGETSYNKPSRFISEINTDLLDVVEIKKSFGNTTSVNSNFSKNTSSSGISKNISDGTSVFHSAYGRGVVVSSDDKFFTIAFDKRFGIKKILKDFKGLQVR